MSNQEEWNEFLGNLFNNAIQEYQDSDEFKFLREKREQIDKRLSEKHLEEKEKFYDDFVFEMGLDEERKTEVLYRKGLKDCIFILKELGVLE